MDQSVGLRKWAIWGILVITFMTVFFHRLAIGTVSDNLSKDLGLNAMLLGQLTSMTFYAYALMQLPVGIMVDTVGVRKISTIGTAITGIGSILFGASTTITLAFASRFMVGLGTSVIMVSIMKVQVQWFHPKKFSTLSGLTSFLGNIGAFMATIPLAYLAVNLGWRATFYALGGISLVLALGIGVIVKEKEAPNEGVDCSKQVSKIDLKQGIMKVFKNKHTWPNFFILASIVGASTTFIGLWGMPYMMDVYHLTKQEAASKLAFASIGFILGAPIVGWLSDRLQHGMKIILYGATISFTFLWFYILILQGGQPPMGQLPLLFFIMGFSVIGHILAFTNVKDVNDSRASGVAAALVNVGEFVGSALLSLSIGFILDKNWTGRVLDGTRIYDLEAYRRAFLIILFMGVMSIISVKMMKVTKGSKLSIKEERI